MSTMGFIFVLICGMASVLNFTAAVTLPGYAAAWWPLPLGGLLLGVAVAVTLLDQHDRVAGL